MTAPLPGPGFFARQHGLVGVAAPGCSRRSCIAAIGVVGAAGAVGGGGAFWPLASAATAAHAPQWPATLTLDYEIGGQARGLPYRASGQLAWRATAHRYDAELKMRAPLVGTRTQRSSGRQMAAGLQPERFTDHARRERRYELDWTNGQFRYFRDNELMHQGPLASGAQDRLSLFFELALRCARLPIGADAASEQLAVLGPGGLQAWTFAWQGSEKVETPAGTFTTRRVQRQPQARDDTRMSLWLHEALGWLPARILLQDDNGDVVDQRLRQWPRI